jgi:hypothetical protein
MMYIVHKDSRAVYEDVQMELSVVNGEITLVPKKSMKDMRFIGISIQMLIYMIKFWCMNGYFQNNL